MSQLTYDKKAIGQRIRRKRKELRLTQAELAEKIDRVPKFCADIERGQTGMGIETLLALCHALEMTPTSLLMGEDATAYDISDDLISQIVSVLSDCTEEQKLNVLHLLQSFVH